MSHRTFAAVGLAVCLVVAGCAGPAATPTPTAEAFESEPAMSPAATPATTPTPTATRSPSPTASPTPSRNPWPTDVLYVAVDDSAVPDDRDVLPLVEDVLEYWNENAASYGEYAVEFRLAPDRPNPHVLVSFEYDVTCGGREAVGCAPLLEAGGYRPERPSTVRIETGYVDAFTRPLLIHEFGHVLGIEHGEPPREYMSPTIEYAEQSVPNLSERRYPWPDRSLRVYVDEETLAKGGVPAIREAEIDRALAYYASDRDDGWVKNLTFTRVDDEELADVTIRPSADPPCDAAVCPRWYRHDVDDDDAYEFYADAEIVVYTGIDDNEWSWYVAAGLAYLLGADDWEDVPADVRESEPDDQWDDP